MTYTPPAPAPPGLVIGGPQMVLDPPRRELGAASVGPLLFFGGGLTDTGNASDAVDVFDLSKGGAKVGSGLKLAAARAFDGGQNQATVCRGKIYLAGGAYANGSKSAIVDVFDSASLRFDTHLTLSAGRSFLAVAALEAAGLVFFGGGELAEDEAHPKNSKDSSTVDIWSVEKSAWLPVAQLSVGRKKLAATTLHDHTVLFGGGFKSGVEPAGYRAEVDIVTVGAAAIAASTSGGSAASMSSAAKANTEEAPLAMKWSTAKLAQGRMRLAAASSGDCALFAGGEVNTTNNDGSGIVDMYCGGEWSLTELSIRRYVT